MKGFALLVSLLLLLLLTLFGFSLLLMAGSHYGSARSLFENENAKLACESALWSIVTGYNSETEEFRLARPPEKYWSELQPFSWNGYTIEMSLSAPWKSGEPNRMNLSARRGQYFAEIVAELRQRRFEDFALFSDAPQTLSTSSVFDGLVYVKGELSLVEPDVQFRNIVQADVFPADFGSYWRKAVSNLDYPGVDQFLQKPFLERPETPQDITAFRKGDEYVVRMDDIRLVLDRDKWFVQYKGKAVSEGTVLYFDDNVHVNQSLQNSYFHISSKPVQSLYLISAESIIIESSLSFR
ncbi:MAG TPA: hypothetical protein VJ521_08725 [Acidobacteriota bacterium]|nr:hypothetical protein [Acidobacteriota bacterium]